MTANSENRIKVFIKTPGICKLLTSHLVSGLNIFYLVLSVHTFIHEDILVQALGLERKQCAYRVLLPNMKHLYNLCVLCELSKSMGKTEFSSTTRNKTNSVS